MPTHQNNNVGFLLMPDAHELKGWHQLIKKLRVKSEVKYFSYLTRLIKLIPTQI